MNKDPRDEFLEVFLRHQRQVYAFIASLLPYGDDADEVFQQTSLILWKKWEQFNPEADFVSLACGVARNELRSFLRRKGAASSPLSEQALDLVAETQFHEQSRRTLRSAAFSECLDELKPDQRNLIERVYADREPTAGLAGEMDVSVASLYMKLHRIRKKISVCMDRVLAREKST